MSESILDIAIDGVRLEQLIDRPVDITFSFGLASRMSKGPNAIHYRVLASVKEDWSGCANDFPSALKAATARAIEICARLRSR